MALLGVPAGASAASAREAAAPVRGIRRIERSDAPLSLAGPWRFHVGDDPAWASPRLDDRDWPQLEVPGPWGRQGYRGYAGLAWYRLELALSDQAAAAARAGRLGLRLGDVDSSYELYVGGVRVGGVGRLPPRARPMYDRHAVFAVPVTAVGDDGRLAIALRVWRSPLTRPFEGGITSGPVEIGSLATLQRALLLEDFPYLGLVVIFSLAGIYHLYLFGRRPALREYMGYGATALLLAAYTFLRTQLRFALSEDFVLLKNLEYAALYLVPVAAIQFFYDLFARRMPRSVRAVQLASALLAVGALATPTLGFNLATLTPWQVAMVAITLATFALVVRELRRGHPEARMFVGSFALLGLGVVNDVLRDQGLVQTPPLLSYAFALFVMSMAAALANRFARTCAALEDLNARLEDRVRAQTIALEDRTAELESKNDQLAAAYQQLQDSSLTDPLTRLRNRRFYQQHIDFDVSRVVREHAAGERNGGRPSALVFFLVDVDHFKRINDRHGHAAGDQVLAQAGRILRSVCRNSDFLVRWGGEEFLIVSRFVERGGAAVLAERLRSSIAEHVFVIGSGLQSRITVSVGFACFPLCEGDATSMPHEAILEIADACLYRVKETGRNGWMGVVRSLEPTGGALRLGRGERWNAEGLEIASSREADAPLSEAAGS